VTVFGKNGRTRAIGGEIPLRRAGPTLNIYIVLDTLRWQIRTVVDANAITSIGTKQGAP
jgi:hypothetical protein